MIVLLLNFNTPGDDEWQQYLHKSVYAKVWEGVTPSPHMRVLLGRAWDGQITYPLIATIDDIAIHPADGITQVTCSLDDMSTVFDGYDAKTFVDQLAADGWQGFLDDGELDMRKWLQYQRAKV